MSWLVSLSYWDRWRRITLKYLKDDDFVLELGFGTGGLLKALAEKSFDCVGLEFSTDMIKFAQKKLDSEMLSCPMVRGSGLDLPFSKGAFTVLVATFPEQYIATSACMKECFRVLHSKGRMVIVGRYVELRLPLVGNKFPVFYRPLDTVELESFIKTCEDAGFVFQLETHDVGMARHHVVILKKVAKPKTVNG